MLEQYDNEEQKEHSFATKNDFWGGKFYWDRKVVDANVEIFKNKDFRQNQQQIINATLSGKDVIALLPTGAGKSLCFQLPATIGNGLTIVVMPLLSLIEDNLNYVTSIGIKACTLSGGSELTRTHNRMGLLNEIRNLVYKIVYVTPEQLVNSQFLAEILQELYARHRIDRIVIDEVHCVSQWGQDFRKDFLALSVLKQRFPSVPLLCLTATATPKVKEDIIQKLNIEREHLVRFQNSFNRSNLIYEIRTSKSMDKDKDIVTLLRARFKNQSGIIYCTSRKDCELLSEKLLRSYRVQSAFYHADLPYAKRQEIQMKWMKNEIQVIIATIAFGLGINKPDVRFVMHYNLPKSLEGYVQECGRSGRDGLPASCILYYSYGDRRRTDYFIAMQDHKTDPMDPDRGGLRREKLSQLYSIISYIEEPHLRRRKMQLLYLDEHFKASKCEKMCDNCKTKNEMKIIQVDRTQEAKTIANMIIKYKNLRINVTLTQCIEIFQGKNQTKQLRCDIIDDYFGKLKHLSETELRRLILKMLTEYALEEEYFVGSGLGSGGSSVVTYIVPSIRTYHLKNDLLTIKLTAFKPATPLACTVENGFLPPKPLEKPKQQRYMPIAPKIIIKSAPPIINLDNNSQDLISVEDKKSLLEKLLIARSQILEQYPVTDENYLMVNNTFNTRTLKKIFLEGPSKTDLDVEKVMAELGLDQEKVKPGIITHVLTFVDVRKEFLMPTREKSGGENEINDGLAVEVIKSSEQEVVEVKVVKEVEEVKLGKRDKEQFETRKNTKSKRVKKGFM